MRDGKKAKIWGAEEREGRGQERVERVDGTPI